MGLGFDTKRPSLPLLESRDEIRSFLRVSSRMSRVYRSFALRALATADRDGGDMLEIGPGPGRYLAVFAGLAPTWRITGLDVSGAMLEEARAYLAGEGVLDRVTLVHGDATAAPFPDESFDLICAMNIVHNVGDPTAFFREVARMLRPGGVASIQVWNRGLNPLLALGARMHTALYSLIGSPLDGAAVVLRSSLNASEVCDALRDIDHVSVEVTGGGGPSLHVLVRRSCLCEQPGSKDIAVTATR